MAQLTQFDFKVLTLLASFAGGLNSSELLVNLNNLDAIPGVTQEDLNTTLLILQNTGSGNIPTPGLIRMLQNPPRYVVTSHGLAVLEGEQGRKDKDERSQKLQDMTISNYETTGANLRATRRIAWAGLIVAGATLLEKIAEWIWK